MMRFSFSLCALGIAANVADRTAAFVFYYAAALGTGAAVLLGDFRVDIVAAVDHVVLDRFCHRIGAGEHAVVTESGRAVAGDAQELLDHLAGLDAAAPCQRHHAADRLALGGRTSARFAHRGKEFEQSV